MSLQSLKLLWAQHKGSGAFRAIVAQEFERALADLSTDRVMKHEAEVSQKFPLLHCYIILWLLCMFTVIVHLIL